MIGNLYGLIFVIFCAFVAKGDESMKIIAASLMMLCSVLLASVQERRRWWEV